jgi:endonuclease/exonuclease/phosphatase (EEP) superfamily protein YafD
VTPRALADKSDILAAAARRRGRIPGFITALIGGGLVVAVPFVARQLDGTADEFSSDSVPILPAFGWLMCAVLGAVVVTHGLQMLLSVDEGPVLALLYDSLPVTLLTIPVIGIIALVAGHQLLAGAAGLLSIYYLVLVLPRLVPERKNAAWAATAPRVRLAVANVYVDNPTPGDAAGQLVSCDADVIVIAEATPKFVGVFDDVGGREAYPHRLNDPNDTSDYAVLIASRVPLGEKSRIQKVGPLTLALAEVCVEDITVTVATLNPMATLDPDGHTIWKQQIEALEEFLPTITGPLVVAGDLNMTSYRPEFKALLRLGLSDAIDALGKALKPSFSLKSVWPLGAFGRIARLDHALTNHSVRAVSIENMEPCGSDHTPFVITVALRSGAE